MTAPKKHWYLIAYDVRDPRRLRRVHYHLRRQALAVQYSVFAIEADAAHLDQVLDGLRRRLRRREDDVRLYPIADPDALWMAGTQIQRFAGMHGAAKDGGEDVARSGWLRNLLGRRRP